MTLNLRQLSCITADITPDQGTVNLGESDGGGDDDGGGGGVGLREVAGGPLNSLLFFFFFLFLRWTIHSFYHSHIFSVCPLFRHPKPSSMML